MSKTPSKKKACGICGKTAGKNRKLMITECCDNWICDDELKYKESCARAHRRESICGYHHIESHPGKWQDCNQCKEDGVEDEFPINESFYEKPPPKVSILLMRSSCECIFNMYVLENFILLISAEFFSSRLCK